MKAVQNLPANSFKISNITRLLVSFFESASPSTAIHTHRFAFLPSGNYHRFNLCFP
jgi:hypothetical protein